MSENESFLVKVGTGPVASAEVGRHGVEVDVHFHVDCGHTTPGTRARLVARVFDLPELRASQRLRASVPLGDAELLAELRRRCPVQSTRAAGASCLVDAVLIESAQSETSG